MASGRSTRIASDEAAVNWATLPRELLFSIFIRLEVLDILNLAMNVCTGWRKVCKDPFMWRSIDMRTQEEQRDMHEYFRNMCCRAVDLSCGGLEYINLDYFGNNHLINYIADRAGSLRHLRLVSCLNVTSTGLIEAIAKFPMLEEVEISNFDISGEALAAIGRACPLLKTLKYNRLVANREFLCLEFDEASVAIAKTMPELRHLQLFGNNLTDAVLADILDGCPHLETLDLRCCFNLNIVGNLEKRCIDEMKVYRGSFDSVDDYEFRHLLPEPSTSKKFGGFRFRYGDFVYDYLI